MLRTFFFGIFPGLQSWQGWAFVAAFIVLGLLMSVFAGPGLLVIHPPA